MYTKLPWKNIDNIFKAVPIEGYRCIAIDPRHTLTTEDLHKNLSKLKSTRYMGYTIYMFDRPELDKNKCSFYKRFGDKVLYAIDG